MGGEDFLSMYQEALLLFKSGRYDQVWSLLYSFEQEHGMRALLGELLKAYILREQKRYVSEIALLKSLVAEFAQSEDKKRLADAYSLLGAAHRMLGESEAAVAAFVRSAEIEPKVEKKLTEISNALFAANAIEDLQPGKMQALYALYRKYLLELGIIPYPAAKWHHDKIRVGYLSADLRDHAVGQFVRPFLHDYDPSAFVVYVYQLNEAEDFVTADLRRGMPCRSLSTGRRRCRFPALATSTARELRNVMAFCRIFTVPPRSTRRILRSGFCGCPILISAISPISALRRLCRRLA